MDLPKPVDPNRQYPKPHQIYLIKKVGVAVTQTREAGAITGTDSHTIGRTITSPIRGVIMLALQQGTMIRGVDFQITTNLVIRRVITEMATLPIAEVSALVI